MKARSIDFISARLLAELTQQELADLAGVSAETIRRLELEKRDVIPEYRSRVLNALRDAGVRFRDVGIIVHEDGRVAPTTEAVGRFGGWRIRKARWHVKLTQAQLAHAAGVSLRRLIGIEAAHYVNRGEPSAAFYRVIFVLQRRGFLFGKRAGAVRGDSCLVERPQAFPRRKLGAPIGAMKAVHEQRAAIEAAIASVPPVDE